MAIAVFLAAPIASLAQEPIFPPRSSIGLVPPDGMRIAEDFVGFEDIDAGAAITLYDLPAEAFEAISADFTLEALEAQGIRNPGREEVAITGAETAFLITGEQDEQGATLRKWILITTTIERTALVVGEMISESGRHDPATMRDAVLTLTFRARPSLSERIELLAFQVADRADFRPIEATMNDTLLLTEGEGDTITDPTQPIIVITAIPGQSPPAELREEYARQSLFGAQGLAEIRIERAEGFRQRNDDWHEIVAEARDGEGNPLIVMQTLRFSPQGTIRVFATVRLEDRAAILPRIRRVADSVEPR
jgi:hypothetical protein